MPPEVRAEIVRLHEHYGSRQIVRRLTQPSSRKVVQRVLREEGRLAQRAGEAPRLLAAFQAAIEMRVEKQLTTTRILRELQALGYEGGRTILAEYVHDLRVKLGLAAQKKVRRRFETPPGQEMQIDWSPYVVPIAGRPTKVHAFGCLLCASRKLFVAFFRNERQPTLLEALARAFAYFRGCAADVVLDNMSTAVLGRIGPDRKPLWHPRFLAFARHYGFRPVACAVRDPDRKGKKEKSFQLVEGDLLRGIEFASWEDLENRTKVWLDETPLTGNLRVHGTTRQIPNEAWASERELLIQLPEARFPVHEDAVRVVDADATLSVHGTRYTVPAVLANSSVAVRLFAEYFEVLDTRGHVAFSRRYVGDADKGKLIIDPTHHAGLKRRPRDASAGRLDEAFVKRFPELEPLATGIRLRMKSLSHVHVRALLRLVDRFGEEAFRVAALRAQEHRNFSARTVERILEQNYPEPEPDSAPPLAGLGPVILGDVDPGSLDAYEHLDQTANEDGDPQAGARRRA